MTCCMRCGRKFGLIRHRWWRYEFCSVKCKEAHVNDATRIREQLRLGFKDANPNSGNDCGLTTAHRQK